MVMKEIMNNQGESMNINQQEAGSVNSTADMANGYNSDGENVVMDGTSIAALQDTPGNPALDAFYNMPSYAEINPYVVEEKKREYTGIESAFAWISFIFGYMFCKAFPAHVNSFGAFLLVIFAFATTTVVLKVKNTKIGIIPTIAGVSALIVSATLVLNSNPMLQSLANAYAMVTYCYYIYAAQGNSTKKGFTDFIVIDYHKALFVAPFNKLGSLLQGMFSGRTKKSGAVLGKFIKGGLIAFIPTILVCGLLSYDRGFYRIIENMGSYIDMDAGNVFSNIWQLGLGIIVGQYVFRLFLASSDKAVETTNEEECVAKIKSIQKAHVITTLTAVLPIIFIYVIFFISQWGYYMSAFSGKLPTGLSYAEYAREGFFQLCMVSFINMIIIVFVQLFMNAENSVVAKIKVGIVITYAVCTLILIATAMSKMSLYIESYGLTQKRVYSSWLMIVLALLFVVAVVKQFVEKLNAVAVSCVVVVVMFAGLSLSNVDGLIARYNIDRYLEGSLETVDVWAMRDLGDAAVPEMVRLIDELKSRGVTDPAQRYSEEYDLYSRTFGVLEEVVLDYINDDRQIMSYTIPYLRAKDALEDRGIKSLFYEW
ncbi:MAG: DUF4173 domain-containing protein [Lachnospiraceae bacterium]|nr:DUF4173 domain-containing protein [Lachnospiraceae bacterium]